MPSVNPERMAAHIEGDFVVFLIGMRINKLWKVHKWLPVFLAMPRMVKELKARPDSGFLGAILGPRVIVQYWRSFDELEASRATLGLGTPLCGARGTGLAPRSAEQPVSGMKPLR